jgi:hypothetical protein
VDGVFAEKPGAPPQFVHSTNLEALVAQLRMQRTVCDAGGTHASVEAASASASASNSK